MTFLRRARDKNLDSTCAPQNSKCLEFIKTFMIPSMQTLSLAMILMLMTPRICFFFADVMNCCYFRWDTHHEHPTTNGSRLRNFVIKRSTRIGGWSLQENGRYFSAKYLKLCRLRTFDCYQDQPRLLVRTYLRWELSLLITAQKIYTRE